MFSRNLSLRHHAHWLLAAAVFLIGLPWLGSEGTYHGDERFYTDAALRMIADGNAWAPEYADGSARLNKPLLVYWLIAVPFELLGPSLFAARLPFLVAGALLVGVTGRLARALFPTDPRAPFLAAAIVASNISLAALAVRSTPDILLALATAITWVGIAELLVGGRPARAAARWLWLGIGFAAAAKGSLSIVLVLFVVSAIAVLGGRGAWRALLLSPWLVAAIALAGVSLVPLWLVDAPLGGPSFVQDQVSTRLSTSPLEVVGMGLGYSASLTRHFLPWILAPIILAFANRTALREAWRGHRRGLVLVLAFTLLMWLVFSAANLHRGRYLTPIYPAFACATAVFVPLALDLRGVRRGVWILTVLVAVAAGLMALVALRVDIAAAIGAGAAAAVATYCAWKVSADQRAPAFAIAFGALVLVAVPALRHAFRSGDYARAAAAERIDAAWGFDALTPSILRVLSGGRVDPRSWPATPSEEDFARASVVIARGPARAALEARGWSLEQYASRHRNPRIGDLLELLGEPDPSAWLAERGEPVYFARRPPAMQPTPPLDR